MKHSIEIFRKVLRCSTRFNGLIGIVIAIPILFFLSSCEKDNAPISEKVDQDVNDEFFVSSSEAQEMILQVQFEKYT